MPVSENTMPVWPIVEVLGQAAQGVSRPYLCRAEDGHLYYVKGQQTNRSSLWAEWICANLARALGLPVPPFGLAQVDKALLTAIEPRLRDLGTLPAFASRNHPRAVWLEPGFANQVPLAVQREVLVFDWWVQNPDRSTGNANLLWDADRQELVVIDHNLALGEHFDADTFLHHHVFAAQWPAVAGDPAWREHFRHRLRGALPAARAACRLAPDAWAWENPEFDLPARFSPAQALTRLSRIDAPDFWTTG